MKTIIADTSCLIVYDKIGQLEILRQTLPNLIVTKEVEVEFGVLPDWVRIKELKDRGDYFKLLRNLGKGEASSISLALELDNSLLIMDEKKGRKVAQKLRIETIGSLGVLMKAKEKKIIKSVGVILNLIDGTDFRLSRAIREEILKESGELK